MWSGAFNSSLRIDATLSRYLAAAIGVTHGLGLVAALFGPWPASVAAGLAAAVAVGAASAAWNHLLDGRIRVAVWLPDGAWRICSRGKWRTARLVKVVRWSTLWVVLSLEPAKGRRRTLILGRDAVEADVFRRLRSRLTVSRASNKSAESRAA